MTLNQLGSGQHTKTIFSGVMSLAEEGFVGIAIILFVASFIVPLAKLIGLLIILLYIKFGFFAWPLRLSKMYNIIVWIGRWSMLDVYVLTLWASLVQLDKFANVNAEIGATAFGSLVVITMLAAATFDSRLIWDKTRNILNN